MSSGSLSKVDPRTGLLPNTPVVTTDVGDLPYEMDGEVKVFRLTAHVFKQQIAPQKTIDVWGFNGSAPGPTIQVTQGDRVRVIFKNELPEPSSIHWHGFEDQLGNDGMPGISQAPVKPGESFTYNFVIRQEGTFFYHSHMAMQEMAGMLGGFIMHPKTPYRPHCDKDFLIHLQEYQLLPNATTPDTMGMHWNWLLLNGKAGPATTPLVVRQGDRVRIRFVNLGMQHHPMHVHGHTFYTTGTEGGRIPETAWWPGNTVLVGVAQARDVEFIANNPGDWMLHCHLPHHMMNSMANQAGPMTRMAGFPDRTGLRGDDSHGHLTQPGANMSMGMQGMDMKGMQRGGSESSNVASDPGYTLRSAFGRGTGRPGRSLGQYRARCRHGRHDGGADRKPTETQPRAEARSRCVRYGRPEHEGAESGDVSSCKQRAELSAGRLHGRSPMMNMDKLVEKPENLGLRPNWSRFMQGMMTFVRVLPPEQYDQVVAAMKQARRPADPYVSLYVDPDRPIRG